MHLGLTDRPFVPHNLISSQESPVPLLKLQMSPRITILMTPDPKGTQIYSSCLSKVPANEPPPGSPTGPLWRGKPAYRAFCVSLKTSSFGLPSKGALPPGPLMESLAECCPITWALQRIFQAPQWRSSPSQTPSTEPLHGERRFIQRALFTISQITR